MRAAVLKSRAKREMAQKIHGNLEHWGKWKPSTDGVWRSFTKYGKSCPPTLKKMAVCLECIKGGVYKQLSQGTDGSTGSLVNHLRSKHSTGAESTPYAAFEHHRVHGTPKHSPAKGFLAKAAGGGASQASPAKAAGGGASQASSARDAGGGASRISPVKATIPFSFLPKDSWKDCLVELVVSQNLPFSFVECAELNKMVQILNRGAEPMSRRNLENRMRAKRAELLTILAKMVRTPEP